MPFEHYLAKRTSQGSDQLCGFCDRFFSRPYSATLSFPPGGVTGTSCYQLITLNIISKFLHTSILKVPTCFPHERVAESGHDTSVSHHWNILSYCQSTLSWIHLDWKPAQVSVDAMRLVTTALEQSRIYTVNSEVTNQLGSSRSSGNGKPHIPPEFYITVYFYKGQTYLMFCCSSPAGQNFSIFEKN